MTQIGWQVCIYTSDITNSVCDVGPALQPSDHPGQDNARSPENVSDKIFFFFIKTC